MAGGEVLQDVEESPLNGEDDVLKPARNGSAPEDLSLERAKLVPELLTSIAPVTLANGDRTGHRCDAYTRPLASHFTHYLGTEIT
jgi:hypothetical protein